MYLSSLSSARNAIAFSPFPLLPPSRVSAVAHQFHRRLALAPPHRPAASSSPLALYYRSLWFAIGVCDVASDGAEGL